MITSQLPASERNVGDNGDGGADYERETNFTSIPMLPVSRGWGVCYARCSTMSSPYFTQCSSVITRSGSQGRTHHTPAASLRSKLTGRQATTGQVSSAAVKVEEEEARISGNVYVGRPPFYRHLITKHVTVQFFLNDSVEPQFKNNV